MTIIKHEILTYFLLLLISLIGYILLIIRNRSDRTFVIYITIIYVFFYFYTTIGASIQNVSKLYFQYYLIYFIIFVISLLVLIKPKRFRKVVDEKINNYFNNFINKYSKRIVFLYLFLSILTLVIPEFKLLNLINPPSPNLMLQLTNIQTNEMSSSFILKIIFYFKILISPFFYISLYKYRNKPLLLFLIIFSPLYFSYCENEYIARSSMFPPLIIYTITLLKYNSKLRFKIILSSLLGIPLLIYFSAFFMQLRVGYGLIDISILDSFKTFINIETTFALNFDKILQSHMRVNIVNFSLWILTLPLPSFLKGFFSAPHINIEMSEIVLGISQYSKTFYVELSNIVSESVYIFGDFFWLQPIFISILISFLYKISKYSDSFFIFLLYNAMFLGYNLHRGGIGAALPQIMGGYLLFYIFLIYLKFKFKKTKKIPQ